MSVPSPAQTQSSAAKPAPITPSTQRRPATSRSIGFTPSSATDNDWRDRDMLSPSAGGGGGGYSPSKSGGGGGGASASPRSIGPGKTIGGFDKKVPDDKDKDGKTNLAHVPCRFFKQGACTAGDTCPFSHSMPEPGKKEICQWFLKGNCKFGHKCALAHVRPGEPMTMDRKNKKDQQREAREKEGGLATPEGKSRPTLPLGSSPDSNPLTSPVAIRSALSSAIQSPPSSANQGIYSSLHSGSPQRHPSSPMREPFGPPSGGGMAGAGFGRSPGGAFSSSPSRPSPLSASFSNRAGTPGSLALGAKSSATVAMHSPLRPPTSAAAGSTMYSSSFSHATLSNERSGGPPLSASFADGGSLARNIWARSETPEEPLSPRRPILQFPRKSQEVFMDDDEEEDHGEDFLPASLNDLLTPTERARRKSRRDSNDSHGVSPGRPAYLTAPTHSPFGVQERLAQSAGANLGPANFLESLWSNNGADKRREAGDDGRSSALGQGAGVASPSGNGAVAGRQSSLLTQQRTPSASSRFGVSPVKANGLESTFPLRQAPLPSSPSARAINEHAPGQSLPGGVATALSRLHMRDSTPKATGGLASEGPGAGAGSGEASGTPPTGTIPLPSAKREDIDDGFFDMDG